MTQTAQVAQRHGLEQLVEELYNSEWPLCMVVMSDQGDDPCFHPRLHLRARHLPIRRLQIIAHRPFQTLVNPFTKEGEDLLQQRNELGTVLPALILTEELPALLMHASGLLALRIKQTQATFLFPWPVVIMENAEHALRLQERSHLPKLVINLTQLQWIQFHRRAVR